MPRITAGFLANIAVGSATEGFPQILLLPGLPDYWFSHLLPENGKKRKNVRFLPPWRETPSSYPSSQSGFAGQ
ncbi:MAG: hypothetical protein ACOY3M_02775 [Patescibacteria group bacterium]